VSAPPPGGDTLHLEVLWSGPFTIETVIADFHHEGSPPDYDGEDYGLYQIYGRHILCGPDTLLYIGQATGQTFSRRFRRHERWLRDEGEIQIYLGRIYDALRHTALDSWKGWGADVRLAECLLIYKYSPNYNAVSISDPPSLGGYRCVDLVHRGERHKLDFRDSAPPDWM
jgi:hypothetical protein